MKLSTRAAIDVPRPVEEVFDLAVSCAGLERLLRPVGPIPGVARAELADGKKLASGVRRFVTMTDGSVMEEAVTAFERPKQHAYRWVNRPALPFSLIVRTGWAVWAFSPSASGTHVEWSYTLELTTPLVYPLARLVEVLFRRWMKRGLERLCSTS